MGIRAARGARRHLSGFVAAALLVTGCGGGEPPAPSPATAAPDDAEEGGRSTGTESDAPPPPDGDDAGADEAGHPPPVLEVVATLAPIADLVSQVGGERIAVTSLVPPGMDAHTYAPRPGDVARLAAADAYLGIGLDLNDGALRLARENLPEAAPVILLGDALRDAGTLVFDHTHDDAADERTHSHDGTTHSHAPDGSHVPGTGPGPNPHVWTSLRNAIELIDGIGSSLSELDPQGADVYSTNAEVARAELATLDDTIAEAVDTIPAAARTLVTYHDAWVYFARDHGLTFATALQPADFSEPSAGELLDLIDLVRELEVPAVFGSEVFPSTVLETLAEETGATYVGDIADDVLPGSPGSPEHTYAELMRRNARAIVTGLGGDASALDDPA